jgi:hypothetical protein
VILFLGIGSEFSKKQAESGECLVANTGVSIHEAHSAHAHYVLNAFEESVLAGVRNHA